MNWIRNSILFLSSLSAQAFVSVQTSTSIGYYRDYAQVYRYPVYHSWNLNGFFQNGIETSLGFILNNDFSENQWKFFPTLAEVDLPVGKPHGERRSRIQLGRQMLTEGFDFQFLDGVSAPYYLSEQFGFAPYLGLIRPLDLEQPDDLQESAFGLTVWGVLGKTHLRGGYAGRELNHSQDRVHLSVLREWSVFLKPQVYLKQEWSARTFFFSQAASELSLALTEKLSWRLQHAFINPKPIKESDSFIYRIFAISPSELVSSDIVWGMTDSTQISLAGKSMVYNSGLVSEHANEIQLGTSYRLATDKQIDLGLGWMQSYGGRATDLAVKYQNMLSDKDGYHIEYDVAYVAKVNNIEGWMQHLRAGYDRSIGKAVKGMLFVEVERNPYFTFDIRTMVYVTNYL